MMMLGRKRAEKRGNAKQKEMTSAFLSSISLKRQRHDSFFKFLFDIFFF